MLSEPIPPGFDGAVRDFGETLQQVGRDQDEERRSRNLDNAIRSLRHEMDMHNTYGGHSGAVTIPRAHEEYGGF